ncbi:molecular chaperone DnaJ [Nitzschia inconspicua]|uniref:Molecular chaperone DnaJ n=1 Tax=Nitzschia inconspicua TaxID=303405 RepID=A0A9K3L279_9STRA|nr:molecular chaperone DnaJ [Nitzschia inconspicua]
MPQFGLLLLVHVFSALLPPVDPDEKTFYSMLDVDRNATPDEIRKAYKKLSLKLHPDKVAQRGDMNADEAAAEYEKVQEAYGVLANEHKRELYDILRTPTRYRFYAQGAMANPGALYENLTGATCIDKTRLLGFVSFMILLVLLQPILIAAKIDQSLKEDGALESTSWFAIFVPYWIMAGLGMIVTGLLVPFVPISDRLPLCLSVLEQFSWYLSMIFLCFRWDGTWNSMYRQIFVPVYFAMLLRWIHSFCMLRKIRSDVQRMVTVDYLEREVLKGKDLEDLEESELKDLQSRFLVVTVPADFEPYSEEGVELNDEKIEEQKVEASPEFEAATEIYNNTVSGVASSIVFGTIFLILLTRKLDDRMDGNWWVVFVPIFLERGLKWLLNFYRCACGRMVGDEIIVQMNTQGEAAEKNEKDAAPAESTTATNEDKESPEEQQNDKPLKDTTKTEEKAPAMEEESIEKPSNEKTTKREEDQTSSTENPEMKVEETEDDEGNNIHIDEETFRAWQNAYAEAEESAMQEQAKASSECCNLSLQLILLCLVVAKVQQSYESNDPNNVGFSTFWILFPFFLFFGIVFCCCSLLIYGASPGSLDDLNETPEEDKAGDDPENRPSSENPPPIALPPTANEEETKEDAVKEADVAVEVVQGLDEPQTKLEVKADMDDLD